MRKLLVAAMAAFVCFGQLSAYNEEKTPAIEVRGKAEVKVVPDELYISVDINEREYNGKYTLEDKQDDLVKILQRHGVDVNNDLKVSHMGSTVKFAVLRKQMKTMASASYIAKVDGIDNLYGIIKDLGKKEISHVSLVETKYSKRDQLELDLATEAVKDAKARAEVLSAALGQQLGSALQVYVRPIYVHDSGARFRNGASKGAYEEADTAGASTHPTVSELEFTVEVTAKFELLGL